MHHDRAQAQELRMLRRDRQRFVQGLLGKDELAPVDPAFGARMQAFRAGRQSLQAGLA